MISSSTTPVAACALFLVLSALSASAQGDPARRHGGSLHRFKIAKRMLDVSDEYGVVNKEYVETPVGVESGRFLRLTLFLHRDRFLVNDFARTSSRYNKARINFKANHVVTSANSTNAKLMKRHQNIIFASIEMERGELKKRAHLDKRATTASVGLTDYCKSKVSLSESAPCSWLRLDSLGRNRFVVLRRHLDRHSQSVVPGHL